MREIVDSRTRLWAAAAIGVGIVLYVLLDIVLNLPEVTPRGVD